MLIVLAFPWPASAKIEWEIDQVINPGEKPLDMVTSNRGTYLFILTDDGIVHVYDSDGNIKDEINVGKNVDHIACGSKENILLLKSKKSEEIQKIAFEFIEKINTAGSPYKGKADAPVVIVEFTDYQ